MESPDLRPGKVPRPNQERLVDTAAIDLPFWRIVCNNYEYMSMRSQTVALWLNQPKTREEGVS